MLKVFVRRGSRLGFVLHVVWQSVRDFLLLSFGLVWVCCCTFPQHSPHQCWYWYTQLTLGRWESPTPSSWGGQQQPDQGQTLAPQLPGNHRPSANDKIICMQIPHCHSAPEGHHSNHTVPAHTLAWALLSHTISYNYRFMRASHTMFCLSLLLSVILSV